MQCDLIGQKLAKTSVASSSAKNRQGNNQPQIQSASWQGPLPPPESLERFNTIVDNGAERIFRMAEIEQQHRIESERSVIQHNAKISQTEATTTQIGVTFGAITSVLAIIACLISIWQGAHWSVSIALVGLPLMGAIRSLITRK